MLDVLELIVKKLVPELSGELGKWGVFLPLEVGSVPCMASPRIRNALPYANCATDLGRAQ